MYSPSKLQHNVMTHWNTQFRIRFEKHPYEVKLNNKMPEIKKKTFQYILSKESPFVLIIVAIKLVHSYFITV